MKSKTFIKIHVKMGVKFDEFELLKSMRNLAQS